MKSYKYQSRLEVPPWFFLGQPQANNSSPLDRPANRPPPRLTHSFRSTPPPLSFPGKQKTLRIPILLFILVPPFSPSQNQPKWSLLLPTLLSRIVPLRRPSVSLTSMGLLPPPDWYETELPSCLGTPLLRQLTWIKNRAPPPKSCRPSKPSAQSAPPASSAAPTWSSRRSRLASPPASL